MPATKTKKPPERTAFLSARCLPESRRQVDELGRWWGPVKELTMTEVIEEALRRCWEAEKKSRKGT
jgi:hypothetical protein